MSGHYYGKDDNGNIVANHNLKPAEAKKKGYFCSVTTKLKLVSSPFLDMWSRHEAIKLTQATPQLPNEDIKAYCERICQLVYGEFTRHYDGKTFPSNEFGTAVHACLEAWNVHKTPFPPEWEMYCTGWVHWLEANQIEPFKSEHRVLCDKLKTAGSIDFLGYQDGLIVMVDYKNRRCPDGKGKFYPDKDCAQMAIEAEMLNEEMGLGYNPRICSMCIDVLTGTYHPKWWKPAEQELAAKKFRAINHCFNVLNGWE